MQFIVSESHLKIYGATVLIFQKPRLEISLEVIYYDPQQINKQAIYFRKILLRNVFRNCKTYKNLQYILLLCKVKGNIFQNVLSDSDTYCLILKLLH